MSDEAALSLAWRILLTVHDEQIARADRAQQGVPLTRLSKRLDASVSVLMREITMLTDAMLGAQRGPGLLRMWQDDGRWLVVLTPEGIDLLAAQDD